MRILVLGGTSFLSKAVAFDAARRGHDVMCAARGRSGAVPDGAQLISLDRNEPDALRPLAGERFDAVVDVATMALPWVRDALDALGARAGHWTFVSSINAYADTATMHQTPASPLLDPITGDVVVDPADMAEQEPDFNGGVKVACENAVREEMGDDRAFFPRAGAITGPGDYMGRLGYWSARFHRGGRVVIPDTPEQPIQHVDVRDLATWIVDAAEQRISGAYDAVGPVFDLGPFLREIAEEAGTGDTELIPVAPEKLTEAGVSPWGGPRSLPLWLPRSHYGLAAHDATSSWEAGLRIRPLADTIEATLAEELAHGLDRPRDLGLTAEQEAALLA